MHREHALERKAVVHHREDRLLDLARVERPTDHDLGPGRVQADERLGARPVLVGDRGDRGRVQHQRLRLHLVELLVGRIDEQRLREQGVPRALGDDADGDAVRGIRARKRVDDVHVAFTQSRCDLLAQPVEVLLRHLGVDLAPPDPVFGAGLADDELVLGGASRVLARVDDERAALGEPRLTSRERMLVEL